MEKVLQSKAWNISDFVLHKELGRGRKSVIYLATHRGTGMELVLKRCKIENDHERQLLHNEIQIHRAIDHPRVISFYGYFFETTDTVYMMLEYAKGGDVWNMLERRQSEEEFRDNIARPVANVLMHIHALGIIHRDIKPENIFLTGMRSGAKVGDFGFATNQKTLNALRVCTLEYMAPEILLCDSEARKKNIHVYDETVDCWAMGVLVHEGLIGRVPWEHEKEGFKEFHKKITENPFVWEPSISREANDFIRKCLQLDQTKRMTSMNMLSHPWLRQTGQVKIFSNHSFSMGSGRNMLFSRSASEGDMSKKNLKRREI